MYFRFSFYKELLNMQKKKVEWLCQRPVKKVKEKILIINFETGQSSSYGRVASIISHL